MSKRTLGLVIILSLIAGYKAELNTASANPSENSASMKVDILKKAADFKLLTPSNSLNMYKLEIKEPYPPDLGQAVTKVRLHYWDESGQRYIFGF